MDDCKPAFLHMLSAFTLPDDVALCRPPIRAGMLKMLFRAAFTGIEYEIDAQTRIVNAQAFGQGHKRFVRVLGLGPQVGRPPICRLYGLGRASAANLGLAQRVPRRRSASNRPVKRPNPPGYPRLLWATWRRFDPSSSPSASLPKVVRSPGDLVGN
jgi:hypothetical protein